MRAAYLLVCLSGVAVCLPVSAQNENSTKVEVSRECAAVVLIGGGVFGASVATAIFPSVLAVMGFTGPLYLLISFQSNSSISNELNLCSQWSNRRIICFVVAIHAPKHCAGQFVCNFSIDCYGRCCRRGKHRDCRDY